MTDVYLNGAILPIEKANVSVLDRGFLFGDGVYEVIPVFNSRPIRQKEHLERLDNSLAAIELDSGMSHDDWDQIFRELLGRNGSEQAIYIQVTRGADLVRRHAYPEQPKPTVMVLTMDLKLGLSGTLDEVPGSSVVVTSDKRWRNCHIKSTSLLGNVMHHQTAHDAGAAETILLDEKGFLTEGSSTNVFVVKDGKIATPPLSNKILPGVTRALVLELAANDGMFSCHEQELSEDDLRSADEVWITSSSKEVMPVIELDGVKVGDGQPGPVWRHVAGLYQVYKRVGNQDD